MQQFITILNVIKKGEGNRPYEALATLCSAEKVLNSIRFDGIDNTHKRTFPICILDHRIMHSLQFKGCDGDSYFAGASLDGGCRCYPNRKTKRYERRLI